MGVNSLPKTVTRQRGDCDLNSGPSAPESSTLTTRLPSHPHAMLARNQMSLVCPSVRPSVASRSSVESTDGRIEQAIQVCLDLSYTAL